MHYSKEKTKSLKKQKNYEELFAYLSKFAKSEIPEALNELAECYYWGVRNSDRLLTKFLL